MKEKFNAWVLSHPVTTFFLSCMILGLCILILLIFLKAGLAKGCFAIGCTSALVGLVGSCVAYDAEN